MHSSSDENRQYSPELLTLRLERSVGVHQGLLGGGLDRLDFEGPTSDDPQGSSFFLAGPPGDPVPLEVTQLEELVELAGDLRVLAEEDLGVAQGDYVLGDRHPPRARVPDGKQVRWLVPDDPLDRSFGSWEPQAGVQRLERTGPQPHLTPHLVADDE